MTLVTDSRCRLTCRAILKPNTPYEAERQPDGRIVLTELVERDDVPIVHPRRVNGRLIGADIKLSREVIAAAVRADRDER